MMNKQEMQAFRELFSKYCRQEINKGHCESDGCEFCSVNSAYDEIFNRSRFFWIKSTDDVSFQLINSPYRIARFFKLFLPFPTEWKPRIHLIRIA